jgi:hypothetical protein
MGQTLQTVAAPVALEVNLQDLACDNSECSIDYKQHMQLVMHTTPPDGVVDP